MGKWCIFEYIIGSERSIEYFRRLEKSFFSLQIIIEIYRQKNNSQW